MRPSSYLAILGALVLVLFVGYFASGATIIETVPSQAASSTGLATLPVVAFPSLELPSTSSSTASTASSTVATTTSPAKAKPVTAPTKPVVTTTTPAPATTTAAPVPTAAELEAASSDIRGALVNIICDSPYGSGLESISGSGVIIDPRGIILTNAHIGQYFLLHNLGVSCVIRTGSPATNAYYASLAFVSPDWLNANSAALTESQPTGTGEHDIALLVITRSATSAPLPASFSYLPLAENAPVLGEQVVIGSYAAQFLQSSEIETSLYPTIVYGAIQSVFTFLTNTIDVVSLGGSAAAQEGSSGGGVVDGNGELVSTITTSTTAGSTADRELDAITASYIRRDYAAETGLTLDNFLAESPANMVASFAPQIPSLEAIITADLPAQE